MVKCLDVSELSEVYGPKYTLKPLHVVSIVVLSACCGVSATS